MMTVATEVRERPILFSAPMVNAILNGTKTQTRRVVKPTQSTPKVAPLRMEPWLIDGEQETDDHGLPCWAGFHPDYPGDAKWFTCPYGQPGDRLWVRETWQTHCDKDTISPRDLTPDSYIQYPATYDGWASKRRPSIFMPRWASRITLEITDVRVERVQDISEGDAKAEGVARIPTYAAYSMRDKFWALWNDINAKRGYSWESNPWVWIVSFRRII